MEGSTFLSGYPVEQFDQSLGKLCIFGCKKQREANRASAAAAESDKVQAAKIEEMRVNNAVTKTDNVQLITQKQDETKKKRMIILGVGAGAVLLLGIVYAIKKSRKK